jgi:hypothetical protein
MSAYFSSFPKTYRDGRQLTNVAIRLDFLSRIKDNVSLFEFLQLKDGQRPEDVALEIYGDTNLYWLVLYMNDIINPYHDWLLSEERLLEYVVEKYGSQNAFAVHHYETTAAHTLGEGIWVNAGEPLSKSVTNYTHELTINEQKRRIKILKPRYVPQVLAEYQAELRDI